MAQSYPALPPDKNFRPKPQLPPRAVVGYMDPVPRPTSRPTTKAEAEAESDRQAGPILARARAKL